MEVTTAAGDDDTYPTLASAEATRARTAQTKTDVLEKKSHTSLFFFVFVERFTKKISHLITEINEPNQGSSFKSEKWAGPR